MHNIEAMAIKREGFVFCFRKNRIDVTNVK